MFIQRNLNQSFVSPANQPLYTKQHLKLSKCPWEFFFNIVLTAAACPSFSNEALGGPVILWAGVSGNRERFCRSACWKRWKCLNSWPKCAQLKHHWMGKQSGSSRVNSTIVPYRPMLGTVASCPARSIFIQVAPVTWSEPFALGWTRPLRLHHPFTWLECSSWATHDSSFTSPEHRAVCHTW